MNDLMIDLETLSLRQNAAIMTIAAVVFDRNTGDIGPGLHLGIAQHDYDYDHVDLETVEWWVNQSAEAKQSIQHMLTENPHRLDFALEKLNRFAVKNEINAAWSNGASFDFPILSSAYRHFGITPPWKFWQERDTRTIVDICHSVTGIDPKKQIKFSGTPHDALSDATHQARYVSMAFQLIRDHNPCSP